MVASTPVGRLDEPANAAAIAGIVDRLTSLAVTVEGVADPVPAFRDVVNPLQAPPPPELGLVSPDGSTVRM